jgi:hypothetical protein
MLRVIEEIARAWLAWEGGVRVAATNRSERHAG